jgi:hypothetical protein
MASRGPYYADKDAWVAQLVGGSTQYGNGSGTLIHMGPVPQSGGGADFKSRGMFEITASDIFAFLDGASSVTSATVTLTVGVNTCLGSRGGTIRLFLEEMTSDFNENGATGCNLNSGTGAGVWGQSNNATTTNRASYSGSPTLGASITFDITALMEARRAASNYTVLRFRVISANSGLTDYDETTAARRISVCSREDGTAGNRPQLSGVVATGSIPVGPFAETGAGTEGFSVSQTGTAPVLAETATGTDAFTGGPIATWSTGFDADSNGRASLYLPTVNQDNYALLATGAIGDVQLRCRVKLNKVPVGGSASFMLIARAIDKNNHYRVRMAMGGTGHDISLILEKVVAGVVTALQTVASVRTFLADTDFWLKLQVEGASPTVLNAKVWRWGDTEPGWLLQIEDSEAALQADGDTGMAGRLSATVSNAPVTMYMDQYEGYAP